VLRSGDGGASWQKSLDIGRATSLVMDPLDPDLMYAAILNKGLYKTSTGGVGGNADWTQQTQTPLPFDGAPLWQYFTRYQPPGR
jgi:hypothetical protein